jgi:hypothetical protein
MLPNFLVAIQVFYFNDAHDLANANGFGSLPAKFFHTFNVHYRCLRFTEPASIDLASSSELMIIDGKLFLSKEFEPCLSDGNYVPVEKYLKAQTRFKNITEKCIKVY